MKNIFSHLYLIVLVLSLFGFIACNNSDNVTNNSRNSDVVNLTDSAVSDPNTGLNKTPEDTLGLSIGCYYKLDDKYSESEDTTEVNNWWRNKLVEFEHNGFQNNVFENKGGGPNGAEWNSSTDLYIVAAIDKILEGEAIEVELNKKKISGLKFLKYIPTNKIGTIIYFKLPKALWEKHLRKITPNDFEGIYGKENLASLKNPIAPLEVGEVVEISINIQNSKSGSLTLTDFFHIAYGE